jgi:hypothetical protein
VLARLYDLAPVIKRHAKHPATADSWSIKTVLPTWCPDLSYADLAIGDGQTASARYLRVLRGETQGAEADVVRAELTEYCALDTLAMVRLLEEMLRLSRGEAGA